jgi:5'-deoxynucleotidase YfbR-like HD superfamily hydrolase
MKGIKEIAVALICLVASASFNFPLMTKIVEAQQNQASNSIYYCTQPIKEGITSHFFVFVKKDSGENVELEAILSHPPNQGPNKLYPGNLESLFPEIRAQIDSSSGLITISGTTAFILNLNQMVSQIELKLTKGDISVVGVDDCTALVGSTYYTYEKGKQTFIQEKIDPIGKIIQLSGLMVASLLKVQGGTTPGNAITIGDIHGNYYDAMSELGKADALIKNSETVRPDKDVVLLGDLIDRAPDKNQQYSIFVWADKSTILGHTEFIIGNHEVEYLLEHYIGLDEARKWGGISIIDYRGESVPKVTDTKTLNILYNLFENGKLKLGYAKDSSLYMHAGFTEELFKYLNEPKTANQAATELNRLFGDWGDLMIKFKDGKTTPEELANLQRLTRFVQDAVWARDKGSANGFPDLKTNLDFDVYVGHSSKSSVYGWEPFKGILKKDRTYLVGLLEDIKEPGKSWKSVFTPDITTPTPVPIDQKALNEWKKLVDLTTEDMADFRSFQETWRSQITFAKKAEALAFLADAIDKGVQTERGSCGVNCPQSILDILKWREDFAKSIRDVSSNLKAGNTETAFKSAENLVGEQNKNLLSRALEILKKPTDLATDLKNKGGNLPSDDLPKIREILEGISRGSNEIDRVNSNVFSQRVPEILIQDSSIKARLKGSLSELGKGEIGNKLMGAAFALILMEPVISDLGDRTNNSFLIYTGLTIKYIGISMMVASFAVIVLQILVYVGLVNLVLPTLLIELLGVTSIEVFLGWTIIGLILPLIINAVYCYIINNDSAMCGCDFRSAKYKFEPNPVGPKSKVTFFAEGMKFCGGRKFFFYTREIPNDLTGQKGILAECNVNLDGSCIGEGNAPEEKKEYTIILTERHPQINSIQVFIANTNVKLNVGGTSDKLYCEKENDKSWLCKSPEGTTLECVIETSASRPTWKCEFH